MIISNCIKISAREFYQQEFDKEKKSFFVEAECQVVKYKWRISNIKYIVIVICIIFV